jgi:hypothetical protein
LKSPDVEGSCYRDGEVKVDLIEKVDPEGTPFGDNRGAADHALDVFYKCLRTERGMDRRTERGNRSG